MRIILNTIGYLVGALVIAGVAALFIVGGIKPKAPEVQAAMARVCPPIITTIPARAPTAPPDDVAGVRIGYALADMEAVIKCLDEGYAFSSEAVWHTMAPAGAFDQRQIVHAELNRDVIDAGFAGSPGLERIVALWRTTTYPPADGERKPPTVSVVEADVVAKFGRPHLIEETALRRILSWSYGPDGAPLAGADEAAKGDIGKQIGAFINSTFTAPACLRNVKLSPLEKPAWNKACGITIRVEIEGRLEDKGQVSTTRIALVDQAKLADGVAQFRAAQAPPAGQ